MIVDVTSSDPLLGQKAVLLFWAPWNDDSKPGGAMDQVLQALAESTTTNDDSSGVLFGRVEAESCSELSKQYRVTMVPTFVLLTASGQVFDRIEGTDDAARVTQAVQMLLVSATTDNRTSSVGNNEQAPATVPSTSVSTSDEDRLKHRLDQMIRSADVMLFMKGTPDAPRCGFSRQIAELLHQANIPFGCFDILQDEQVRQGLKSYSNWPTYPQLYVNGSLVGGLDIVQEMVEEGGGIAGLREQLGLSEGAGTADAAPASTATPTATTPASTLEERLKGLIQQQSIMVFMKGLPSAPKCGFSRQLVGLLDEYDVPYGAFDILQDEQVRQGLKSYSNWPTYPQLYVNGSLVGGLDIVQEMHDDGSLKETLLPGSSVS